MALNPLWSSSSLATPKMSLMLDLQGIAPDSTVVHTDKTLYAALAGRRLPKADLRWSRSGAWECEASRCNQTGQSHSVISLMTNRPLKL